MEGTVESIVDHINWIYDKEWPKSIVESYKQRFMSSRTKTLQEGSTY